MNRDELLAYLIKVYENAPEDERKDADPAMLMVGHVVEFLDYFIDIFSDKDALNDEVVINKNRKIKAIDKCIKDAIDIMKEE